MKSDKTKNIGYWDDRDCKQSWNFKNPGLGETK